MPRRAHVIDIDHLVLEAGALAPAALEAAIGAEVARALHSQKSLAPSTAARVPAIAGAVAARVTQSTAASRGGRRGRA